MKLESFSRSTATAAAFFTFIAVAGNTNAIEPIPEEMGFSGYLLLGVGVTDLKSNTVVGNDIIDVGDDTISSIFQKPESDDSAHPILGVELKYTLPGRNQIFLGSSLEDRLTMDFATSWAGESRPRQPAVSSLACCCPNPR